MHTEDQKSLVPLHQLTLLVRILTVRTLATAIMVTLVTDTPVLRIILTNVPMVLITVTSTPSVSTKTGDSDVDAIAVTRATV